ncbi:MAG: hypothetical protein PVI54_01820 [Desulfobacteraceae bacterium]
MMVPLTNFEPGTIIDEFNYMMAKQNLTTIRGIILAAAWGENGAISAVDIAGYDEKTYRVVNDKMGKQLRACVKKRVAADGIVMTQNNRLTIQVSRYHIDTADSKISAG